MMTKKRESRISAKVHAIISICSFVAIPIYLVCMVIRYDRLAHLYQRPDHPLVNATAMAGFLGAAILLMVAISNASQALRKRKMNKQNGKSGPNPD